MKTFIILSVLCLLLGQTVQLTLKELKTCSKIEELCGEESECGKEIDQKCNNKSVDAIKNNKSCQAQDEYFENLVPSKLMSSEIQNSNQLKAIIDKFSPGELKTKIDAFLSDYIKVYNEINTQQNEENKKKFQNSMIQFALLLQEAQQSVEFPADIVKAQVECSKVCATLLTTQKAKDFQNQLIKCFDEKESQSNSNSNLSLVLQLTIITLAVCFLSLI